jgi:hypothetical protein
MRNLPWLAAGTATTATTKRPASVASKAPKRQRLLDDDDSDDLSVTTISARHSSHRRNDRDASSSPDESRPGPKEIPRTPSSSPPPAAPAIEEMRPSDEAWIMVEDEFNSIASTFTKHLHREEYKKQQLLAAQKSTKIIAALPRPTDGVTALSKKAEIKKQVEHTRVQLKKAAAKRPGQNVAPGSDEEEDEMLIGDRHLAGLMHSTGTARHVKRVLTDTSTKANTRAAAGFAKQDTESPKRNRGEQRLPNLDAPPKPRLPDIFRPKAAEARSQDKRKPDKPKQTIVVPIDDEDDNLDAPVRTRTLPTASKAQFSAVAKPIFASTSMPPPLMDKPVNLRRTSSSISSTPSTSQKTYPRPSLKKESSSVPESPAKKLKFEDMSPFPKKIPQSQSRAPSHHVGRTATKPTETAATTTITESQFAFEDVPQIKSRLLPSRRKMRQDGAGQVKQEPALKVEEVPMFTI